MFPDESGLTTEILNKGKLTPEIAKLDMRRLPTLIGAFLVL